MAGICEGRVVVITGGGRGIGRAEALELASQGARVVVNNRSPDPAHEVAEMIRDAGGEAVAHAGDVSSEATADELWALAHSTFGRVDVLLNNAGMVRDKMLVNMTLEDWDEVIRVNLRGVFTTTLLAARAWRQESKAAGGPLRKTIINTTSSAGLFRNTGQANYSAAKAGVTSLTINAAYELANYGVTANAIAPNAATSMSEHLIPDSLRNVDGFDPYAVDNIAPLAAWLASEQAKAVTARVFEIKGGRIAIAEGWRIGPEVDIGRKWSAAEMGPAIADLVAKAKPNMGVSGRA